jgi:hypothetical protein
MWLDMISKTQKITISKNKNKWVLITFFDRELFAENISQQAKL